MKKPENRIRHGIVRVTASSLALAGLGASYLSAYCMTWSAR
jgi:hypothetical protein